MKNGKFIYNGHTFEAAGRFKSYGIKDILKEWFNHFEVNNNIIMEIDYNEFYSNGNMNHDVFRCEDGRLCVPCGNKLLEFRK